MSDTAKDVLTIIAGQFLVLVLKGDNRSLAQFHEGYVAHCNKLLGSQTQADLESTTVTAARTFVDLLAKRYGWDVNAASHLSACVEDVCRAWVSGADTSSAIKRLRIIDVWSGLASSTRLNCKVPLSLLDYVLMVLLPVVCGNEIRNIVKALVEFSDYETDTLNAIDETLSASVSRLCCGVEIGADIRNELKLIVLLHLPKNEGRLSANTGLAYKMLQRQYANMGGK